MPGLSRRHFPILNNLTRSFHDQCGTGSSRTRPARAFSVLQHRTNCRWYITDSGFVIRMRVVQKALSDNEHAVAGRTDSRSSAEEINGELVSDLENFLLVLDNFGAKNPGGSNVEEFHDRVGPGGGVCVATLIGGLSSQTATTQVHVQPALSLAVSESAQWNIQSSGGMTIDTAATATHSAVNERVQRNVLRVRPASVGPWD
jgi:hypothetical protein